MPRRGEHTPRPCAVETCPRPAVARGLCMTHYKRQRAGKPLVDTRPQPGDVDGHGAYGDLLDDGETVQCHECGHRAPSLGSHIVAAHGMSAREYKIAHGLPLSRGLISEAERVRLRAKAKATPTILRALNEHRDPAAASAARTAESFSAVGEQLRLDPDRARANGDPGRQSRACEVCGRIWTPEPGTSQHRARSCSEECSRVLQSRASRRRGTQARDARIVAAVLGMGRSYAAVAAEHRLTPERVAQIVRSRTDFLVDRGGHPLDDALYGTRVAALARYRDAHGHDPSFGELWEDFGLGEWLYTQRASARSGGLSPARLVLLGQSGADLNPPMGAREVRCPLPHDYRPTASSADAESDATPPGDKEKPRPRGTG